MAIYDSAAARAEELSRLMGGGTEDNNNRQEEDFWFQLLDELRAVAIQELMLPSRGTNRLKLHESLLQFYEPAYDTAIQELDPITGKKCYVLFDLPSVILVDDLIDGIVYIGGVDGMSEYRRIHNQTQLSQISKHSLVAPSQYRMYAYTRPDNKVEIHGNNAIQSVLIQAAFAQPTRVTGFNLDTDRYPVNDAIMSRIKSLGLQVELKQEYQSPEDRLQDFRVKFADLKKEIYSNAV